MLSDSQTSTSYIYIIGQECIKILNYKKVLHYQKNEIILRIDKNKLYIHGSNLCIDYFDEDEMSIHGYIQSINFCGI